jgi:hypothetical protein
VGVSLEEGLLEVLGSSRSLTILTVLLIDEGPPPRGPSRGGPALHHSEPEAVADDGGLEQGGSRSRSGSCSESELAER